MDLNNFGPFSAEVWGTFSDWMMVVVIAVTGFLIWLTFRSQTRVQKLQQISAGIEQSRYESEIRPDVLAKWGFFRDEVHVSLTPVNREIRNLIYKTSQLPDYVIDNNKIEEINFNNYSVNHPIIFKYTYNLKTNIVNTLFSIHLVYQDEIGINYELIILINSGGIALKRGPHKIL
uniref:hypothetical protein n=1 Tax=Pedobacter schmidteae TaxID=2201271 RepID=UPI000EAEF45B|nr:hypothetical protein [Pedobacter schmidteae]